MLLLCFSWIICLAKVVCFIYEIKEISLTVNLFFRYFH